MKFLTLTWHKLVYAVTYSRRLTALSTLLTSIYGNGYFFYQNRYDSPVDSCFYQSVLPGIIFAFPYIIAIFMRWLPESITIPPGADDTQPENNKVLLPPKSILEQKGDLILSYNKNNIVGGAEMTVNNKKVVTNLMGLFMNRYFGNGKQKDALFDWNAFLDCYKLDDTKIYHCDSTGELEELPKQSIPPMSACKEHHCNKDLCPHKQTTPLAEFPEGTVIALKLPKNPDRHYAFLLCNTSYPNGTAQHAQTSLESLEACLTTVWKVIAKTPNMHPHHVCLPFLGKGFSGLSEHAYGVLWSILFSYRKAVPGNALPRFGINICLLPEELRRSRIKLWEAAKFLGYALRG